MSTEDLLLRLQRDLTPPSGAQGRIRTRLQARIAAPEALRATKALLTPTSESKRVIWERISASLLAHRAHGFLVELRGWLSAPEGVRAFLWQRFSAELVPVQQTRHMFWGVKWVATAVLLVFVTQMSPRFFWASPSAALSETMLLPHGDVSILVDEVWQPVTQEVTLRAGMRIQTGEDGQASIVLSDDGVVRLDHGTMIDLVDLSDRMEPASELVPTLSLYTGRLWMQGLVPANLRGLTVYTPVGLVTVNGGSVSIGGEREMRVAVYDRTAQVTRSGKNLPLVAGEWTVLRAAGNPSAQKLADGSYQSPWVQGNLTLDAVHRQEIAALQQTRLAERARILPTSTLYPVKRAVEAVDLFLTIGDEAKMQKQLQHADTRLTEAAALLAQGQTGAVALPLEEYRSTLVALATGSGDATLAQFLLKKVVSQNASDLAATLPGDQAYVLKQAVLETSSTLADGVSAPEDARDSMLLDALSVLTQAVETGNLKGLPDMWTQLSPQLQILKGGIDALKPEVQREASAALAMLALAFDKQEEQGQMQKVDPILLQQISAYLPAEEAPILSESDIQLIVAGIRQRIFVYHLTQARLNQFTQELKLLEGHADQGRILRRLYFALPGGPENFPDRVRQEIIRLGWQKASQS
ncbi:MAG: DUF5667 domain-containing protein [Candidatus Peribacteraceae bacterium]|nr:DUF5667 domain-containing protein [Candidatus Peribacteraceae bacterium]MDD5742261.1 DUF5667 domain-containing protein [Candidatus Peribacteraceae bacterium]